MDRLLEVGLGASLDNNAEESLSTGASREAPVDSERFTLLCGSAKQSNATESLSTNASATLGKSRQVGGDEKS